MLSLLSGCASVANDPEDSGAWRSAQEKILIERAEKRWAALINRDFAKAYEFQSPSYRAVSSLQQFSGGFGSFVAWSGAKAESVRYDSPVVATVVVRVEYGASLPGNQGYASVRYLHEKWVYSDANWWFTAKDS